MFVTLLDPPPQLYKIKLTAKSFLFFVKKKKKVKRWDYEKLAFKGAEIYRKGYEVFHSSPDCMDFVPESRLKWKVFPTPLWVTLSAVCTSDH